MDKDFIEANENAVFEEMGKAISGMNEILIQMINTPDDKSGELSMKKLLFSIFHSLGSLTALYNEYYILKTGNIPSEGGEPKIGFNAIIEQGEKK